MNGVRGGPVPIADGGLHLVECQMIRSELSPIQTMRREGFGPPFEVFPNRTPRAANATKRMGR
jgi:hypothetical protein